MWTLTFSKCLVYLRVVGCLVYALLAVLFIYALLAVPNNRNFACRRSVGLRVGVMLWMTPFFFESSNKEALSGDSWVVGVDVDGGVGMVLALVLVFSAQVKRMREWKMD